MSMNAARFGAMSIKSVGMLAHMGIAAEAEQAKARAEKVAQLNAHYRDQLRAGYGVAWVHGSDLAPLYDSGEGMSVHLGEVRKPAKAKPRHGVVVMQNHKFCWLQLP